MAEEDRNKLFNEIRNFSQRKLKKVETKVVTGSGEQLTEKRSPKGLQQVKSDGITGVGYVVDHKPDLQVGMIIPGLLISSQDVAQDKSLLETYEITHILNLAPGVPNAFEDDYNYKKIEILDVPETDITQYFDECLEFISEGIQRGNCLVHCNAGVSRSTAICCAYLMKEKKMKYKDALATVREARAFAKPNDGFAKQLEQYEDKLFGQMAAPDQSEDKFMARKRAEIEAEKAAISGTSSVKNKLAQFGAQLESVYAQRLQSMTPIKLPLKKKAQVQPQPLNKDRKKSSTSNLAGPPPPPPPPMMMNDVSKKVAPPPPPPPQIFNDAVPSSNKQKPTPNKVFKNEFKPINNNQVNEPPRRTAKSDYVDETPINIAAQKKLWETTHSQQPEMNNVQSNKVPSKVKAQPAMTQKPVYQPQPAPEPQPAVVNKTAPYKGPPTRTNKLGTWEKCPATNESNNSRVETASPEPKKKITIKKKDANNNIINESTTPKRSTRDLAAAIEATATDSNSSTPFSSPGTQRKQMYYGRRTSTQPINAQPQPEPVATTRKPAWGLRDQVDLFDSTPSSTPTRCRSPALAATPRDSQSPSPQPASTSSPASSRKVFGRVPPRRTSLTGAGVIGANNGANDFMPISPPPITVSDLSCNGHNNVDPFLRKPLTMMIDRMNNSSSSRSPSPINRKMNGTSSPTKPVEYWPMNHNQNYSPQNHLQQQPRLDRSTSLSGGHLNSPNQSPNCERKFSYQPVNNRPSSPLMNTLPIPVKSHGTSGFQQQQQPQQPSKSLSEQQKQARDFIQRQLEAPIAMAPPLVRRHTTNDRMWANRHRNIQQQQPQQQQYYHQPVASNAPQTLMNGHSNTMKPPSINNLNNTNNNLHNTLDPKRRDQLAQSMFLQQIEPSFGRQAITPPPNHMIVVNESNRNHKSNQNIYERPVSPNILFRLSPNESKSPPTRIVLNRSPSPSPSQSMNSINGNYFNHPQQPQQQQQPERLIVIRRSPQASHQNICFATDY